MSASRGSISTLGIGALMGIEQAASPGPIGEGKPERGSDTV